MSYPQPADYRDVQITNSEITLEQLDLDNRRLHHLHDEIIASRVTAFIRRIFLQDTDEQLS